MIPRAFSDFLEQLRDLADRADRERLLVLYPEFAREYPAVAATLEQFVNAPTAEAGRASLFAAFPALAVLWPIAPEEWRRRLETSFYFLHETLHGRISNGRITE
jgi:hypothetical protein